ncbi:hypothetical protein Tcan_10894 [Toxocara canis]|uniref:Uncharacterized protein n=1 Tax=Toxocara canis TaxID=6265 RepID=A0A0B2VTA4_TOXCA|nr:hypothetical protein Tcan_10894 [Toxocara canis]
MLLVVSCSGKKKPKEDAAKPAGNGKKPDADAAPAAKPAAAAAPPPAPVPPAAAPSPAPAGDVDEGGDNYEDVNIGGGEPPPPA